VKKEFMLSWTYYTVDRRGFFMPPKKGQKFTRYPEETKKEAVRLRVEEGLSLSEVKDRLGIKSDAQIVEWVRKYQAGETFEDYRGLWKKKNFSSIEEENAHLKAQVEYLKKLNPNLHGEGSWIKKPGSGSSLK
jgi:transposase